MKYITNFPFEFLTFMTFFYYSGILIFVENTTRNKKLEFFAVNLIIFFLMLLVSYTFRPEINKIKEKYFLDFISGTFWNKNIFFKLITITKLSIPLVVIASIIEFLITYLFTSAGAITLGFPLPFYSFTANKILLLNFFGNIFLFMTINYIVGEAYFRERKTQIN